MGVHVHESDESIRVIGQPVYHAIDVKALVYPGFATDLQSPMTTLLTQARGTSLLIDNVYNNRFQHIPELVKMGARISIEGRKALIEQSQLRAARVAAADLRAGAALFIAGMCTPLGDVTEVLGLEYIDRGYDQLIDNLTGLGAVVWREPVENFQKKA